MNVKFSEIQVTTYEEDLKEGHFFVVQLYIDGLELVVGRARSMPVATIIAFENAANSIRKNLTEMREQNANASTKI